MDKQIDIALIDGDGDHLPRPLVQRGDYEAGVQFRWLICDNGFTVAEGEAKYEIECNRIDWRGNPPPPEHYTEVTFELDRVVKRRCGISVETS